LWFRQSHPPFNEKEVKMYSVFLVDDEHIVLDGIRNKIDWDNCVFTFAGEATDGELAYNMIQDVKPDILITDIKMPFMDGLELSRMLKKSQPWIKIIILSGHDEFDYAKEAISIGVEDYILKPFTSEDLLKSLNKVKENLDKERKHFLDYNRLKEDFESNSILVKNKFLTDLVLGNLDSQNINSKIEELNIDFESKYFKILISEIRATQDEKKVIQIAHSKLFSLCRTRDDVTSFFIGPNRFVSIIKASQEHEIENDSFAYAEAIVHIVTQDSECRVIIAIGKTVEQLSLLTSSYFDAEHVLEQTRFWNKSRIVSSDDIEKSSDGFLSLQENDPLVDRLRYANHSEIENIINQYLELLKDNNEQFPVIASYLFVDVIMAVSKLVENLGGNIKELMPEVLSHDYVVQAVQNQEIFADEVKKLLNSILSYRDSRISGKYGDVILKAKAFIDKNYASQDTCLRVVADYVHFSPNHFSTIFSQECGITFIEYLTNVRIDVAKKMLIETDNKSSDIAYDCGFSDPHYFSFIFKKTTGMTPREYKNSQTHY